ncbi:adenylate kinase isoenzyme 1-like [Rhinatrema bivittatum]|uniref:adenylate kinase isoenzyme 1-like n=1 Tax=Rhinatrema bivittatum TaxID=194408 RepID=UPI00112E9936|nr:adenylate kinase isoenzyme 1-like [Rhinatrema bivittatum]
MGNCNSKPAGSGQKRRQSSYEKLKSQTVILVLGGPGSGRNTQCEKIVAKYGYNHFCIGDLLRVEASYSTSRGRQIRDIMQKGESVALDIVMELLRDNMLTKLDNEKGYLIDGFPRDVAQAEAFEKMVGLPKVVIMYECSAETMVKRLLIRGQTSHRFDDNEETIKRRMEGYFKQEESIVNYYQNKNLLRKILGEESQEDVFLKTCAVLDSLE